MSNSEIKKTPVSSWGRLSASPHQVVPLTTVANATKQIASTAQTKGLAFGMGRSYGDVCLNAEGTLWQTDRMNRFIHFDRTTGRLRCEAGVLFRDIQQTCIPAGWCLPVTPGTQIVTVGGAIANDVHGKNHHNKGSFGNHVISLRLSRTDGEIIDCSRQQHQDWFTATIGGLGLTGVIIEAEIQLSPIQGPWLESESIVYHGVEEFIRLSDQSEQDWEYTVSWIDCLSGKNVRGIFMRANHIATTAYQPLHNKAKSMPITPPVSLVNSLSLKPFNSLYFYLQKKNAGLSFSHYEPFFYPLDNLHHWNRMYGPKGFYQYQMVVPHNNGVTAIEDMLNAIKKSGQGSFLAVLKTFGEPKSRGLLSFPQPGITLALDFPNKGEQTLKLFNTLDDIIKQANGRIYAAKDARMPAELFAAGYPRLNEFLSFRDTGISSEFSRRIMGF